MTVEPSARGQGSPEDFERDWAEALTSGDPRWLVYPDPARDDQVSLMEWVKARQVLALLRSSGLARGRGVEYGCGSAGMSIFLRQHGYEVSACDLSTRALEVARRNDRLHGAAGSPLPLVAADCLALPFADRSLDFVMSYGLLEHFERVPLEKLLAESVRVLRPGGLFVADIIPARPNARAFGTALNFMAAAAYYLARRDFARLRGLRRGYYGHYFETSHGPDEWSRILRERGLEDVRVRVCRPFPLLAVRGRVEAAYARLWRRLLPLWLAFDASDSWLSRRWGWMYLASGRRPG